jgi:hypothetical protein
LNFIKNLLRMKILFFTTLFCLSLFSCKDKLENQIADCTCEDYKIILDFGVQEGEMIFPSNGGKLYRIQTKGLVSGYGPLFVICSDSTFLNQLKMKQVTDGSTIKFTGGGIGGDPIIPCNIVKNVDGSAIEYLPKIKIITIN